VVVKSDSQPRQAGDECPAEQCGAGETGRVADRDDDEVASVTGRRSNS